MQAKMTGMLYQEQTLQFKHQPQLYHARTPQRGRQEHVFKTGGKGKKVFKIKPVMFRFVFPFLYISVQKAVTL